MSRIHDALKKAEQERSRQTLTSLDPEIPELSGIGAGARHDVLHDAAENAVIPTHPDFEDSAGPLTVDLMNNQVRKFKWNPDTNTMLFFGKESYAPGTEEFRTLRSRLYEMRDSRPLRTILISSASPREGKSFISANLAQIFVQQPNRRVLLIDGDLRWSRLHLSLGTSSTPGLSEYLEGEVDELSVMQRGPYDNLFFIPGGKHALQPSELLANGRLKNLVRRLAPLFDWVIIDSPPAIAVSDPRVMADVCDGVLLVVGVGMVPHDIVQKTRQQFNEKHLLGAVLNRAEPRTSYSYKYYGYYQGSKKDGKKKGRG